MCQHGSVEIVNSLHNGLKNRANEETMKWWPATIALTRRWIDIFHFSKIPDVRGGLQRVHFTKHYRFPGDGNRANNEAEKWWPANKKSILDVGLVFSLLYGPNPWSSSDIRMGHLTPIKHFNKGPVCLLMLVVTVIVHPLGPIVTWIIGFPTKSSHFQIALTRRPFHVFWIGSDLCAEEGMVSKMGWIYIKTDPLTLLK